MNQQITLTGPMLATAEHQLQQVGNIGYAVSAVAQVLEAMHELEEFSDCKDCPSIPTAFSNHYVRGGLTTALDALGGEISSASENLLKLLRPTVEEA